MFIDRLQGWQLKQNSVNVRVCVTLTKAEMSTSFTDFLHSIQLCSSERESTSNKSTLDTRTIRAVTLNYGLVVDWGAQSGGDRKSRLRNPLHLHSTTCESEHIQQFSDFQFHIENLQCDLSPLTLPPSRHFHPPNSIFWFTESTFKIECKLFLKIWNWISTLFAGSFPFESPEGDQL